MILITRDYENSLELSQNLQNKGFKSIIFPLFTIITKKFAIFDKIFLKFYQKSKTILISSSNAIPYLEKLNFDRNIKIFAVGQKTADKLLKLNYKNIQIAQNSAKSLLNLAYKKVNKTDLVIYLSGKIITQDLAKNLRKEGYKTKRIICYHTKEQKYLPKNIIDKIKSGKINDVTIYSQNTLNIFYKLLSKYNLLEYCKIINLLCFGDKIIDCANKIGFTNSKNIQKILENDKKQGRKTTRK